MGPSGAPLEPSSGHLRPWNLRGAPLGALLGPFGGPRGPLLGPSWALWEPSWAHLGPPWTLLGAIYGRLRAIWNPLGTPRAEERKLMEIIRKIIVFSTCLASGVPSGSVLEVSEAVLEASSDIREASGAVVARLGGVLHVVFWPSEAVRRAAENHFEPIWSPKRGAGIYPIDVANREPGGVGPCKTGKTQPDNTLAF